MSRAYCQGRLELLVSPVLRPALRAQIVEAEEVRLSRLKRLMLVSGEEGNICAAVLVSAETAETKNVDALSALH